MPDGHDRVVDPGPEPWAGFAERLRQAHRAVARLRVDDEVLRHLTKQLLVITNLAKHDVEAASSRLDAFLVQLSATGTRRDFHPPER